MLFLRTRLLISRYGLRMSNFGVLGVMLAEIRTIFMVGWIKAITGTTALDGNGDLIIITARETLLAKMGVLGQGIALSMGAMPGAHVMLWGRKVRAVRGIRPHAVRHHSIVGDGGVIQSPESGYVSLAVGFMMLGLSG
jgi:hypothetical protein